VDKMIKLYYNVTVTIRYGTNQRFKCRPCTVYSALAVEPAHRGCLNRPESTATLKGKNENRKRQRIL
jgi:hypothetical protein